MKWTDVVTFMNAWSGLLAILLAFREEYLFACAALLAAAVFDYLDGWFTKRFSKPTKHGMYLDSLADVVSFGVAPVVIALLLFDTLFVFVTGCVFVAAGIFRLARFQASNGVYQGMPITINGILVPLVLFVYAAALPYYFLFSSALMVSKVKLWN